MKIMLFFLPFVAGYVRRLRPSILCMKVLKTLDVEIVLNTSR